MEMDWIFAIVGVILVIVMLAVMFVPPRDRQQHTERPKYRVVAEPGHLPARAHAQDAGLDLRAKANYMLAPGQRHLVGTGVRGAIPDGYVGLIHPRSGLAHNHGVTVLNSPGTVDAGYTGEVRVNLINHGTTAHVIRKGERIAQLLIMPAPIIPVVQVEALDDTERGDNGHGSTGTK